MNDIKNIDCKMAVVEDLFKNIMEQLAVLESQDEDFDNNKAIINKTIDMLLHTTGECDSILCDLYGVVKDDEEQSL